MTTAFYIASAIAVLATVMVITRKNAVHALLYLVVSLLSAAVAFYTLGAPFIAALEVIIYAGAIMVLLIFVIMMFNLGQEAVKYEEERLSPGIWIGPIALALVLFAEWLYVFSYGAPEGAQPQYFAPKAVGELLYGPYLIGVELAGFLLLAGIVGAYHMGRRKKAVIHRFMQEDNEEEHKKEAHFKDTASEGSQPW